MAARRSRSLTDRLLDAYARPGRRSLGIRVLIFALIVGPVITLAAYNYRRAVTDLTDLTFLRRQAIAYLAAVSLRTKFDGIVTIAQTSLDNDAIRAMIVAKDYKGATESLTDIERNLSFVEYLSLISPDGRFLWSVPEAKGVALGSDLSYRPWYKGFIRTGQPTVADLTRTIAEPHQNLSILSMPVHDKNGKLMAILNVSLNMDAFLSWSRAIDAGPSAFVYFTDRTGQVAGHKYISDPANADLPDQSAFPPVQKALRFERGIELLYDPTIGEDAVVAYEPVLRYGWTAIVEQTAKDAFASRDASARMLLLLYTAIVALNVLLAILVLRFIGALAGARRREKMVIDSVGEGLLIIDARGAVIMANPAAEGMLGRKFADMFGKDIDEVAPLRDAKGVPVPRDRRPIVRALAGAKVIENGQYVDAKGRPFIIQQTTTPMRMDREVVGAVVVFRDVTKDLELEIAEKQFVSAASRQLMTPVSASKGFLTMLREGNFGTLSAQQREYLDKLYDLNQRMTEIVDDLLNLSRVELGVSETAVENIDLKDFLHDELKAMEPLARKKKIVMDEDLDGVMPPFSSAPGLLRMVVRNLLSNAVKYTQPGGRITVTLRHTRVDGTDERVLFTVSDTGIGIPAKDRAMVYDKFHRGGNAQDLGDEGTGLGLYIVKAAVAALKGSVWFESTEGKGTSFSVELPARPKQG